MGFILVLFLVALACLLGWVVGETQDLRILRIPCVFVLLILACVLPYGLGRFSGSSNTSIHVTGATHRFVTAAVKQLDDGHAERVHNELRIVAERTNETYESGAFVQEMEDATERLVNP